MDRLSTIAIALLPLLASPALAQTTPGLDATVRSEKSPDEIFATTAASSDLFEVSSSQAALQKSQREDVKAFANHMIRDHGATTEKLKAAATADGVGPLSAPDSKHAQMIKNAEQAKEDHFDEAYLNLQETAHREAIALFENYAENGAGANLKAFATETLPTLKRHLEEVEALDAK